MGSSIPMKRLSAALIPFFFATCAFGDLGGFYKGFATAFETPSGFANYPPHTLYLFRNRLRLNYARPVTDRVAFNASYDVFITLQDQFLSENILVPSGNSFGAYRLTDIDGRVYTEKSGGFFISQNLDRLNFVFSLGFGDITFGRQAIAWGSARVVNPTDVIAPFSFDAIDTEYRVGVDALRVRIPLGALSEIDIGAVLGRDGVPENSAYFVRNKIFVLGSDITAMAVNFRNNLLVAIDITRPVGGAGSWIEAAYVFAGLSKEHDRSGDYFRMSVGADYSLSDGIYAFIEYHRSTAGARHPEEYISILSRAAYTEGTVYLLGRDYMASGLNWQVSPLVSVGATALYNINDASSLVSVSCNYNIFQNVYIRGGAYIPTGVGRATLSGSSLPKSEFGAYPGIYFASLGIYF